MFGKKHFYIVVAQQKVVFRNLGFLEVKKNDKFEVSYIIYFPHDL